MIFTEKTTVKAIFAEKVQGLPWPPQDKAMLIDELAGKGRLMSCLSELHHNELVIWCTLWWEEGSRKSLSRIAEQRGIELSDMEYFIEKKFEQFSLDAKKTSCGREIISPLAFYYYGLVRKRSTERKRELASIISRMEILLREIFPNYNAFSLNEKRSSIVILAMVLNVFQKLDKECFGLWLFLKQNRIHSISTLADNYFGDDLVKTIRLYRQLKKSCMSVKDRQVFQCVYLECFNKRLVA